MLYTENYDPLEFGSTDFETIAKILLENWYVEMNEVRPD